MFVTPFNIFDVITPSDSDLLPRGITAAVFVGTGGALAVVAESGISTIFANVPSGTTLPIAVKGVLDTGTDADDLVAFYGN